MTQTVVFGTSGWRGIIADDFTFDNVKRCTQALADHLLNRNITKGIERKVVIGHDCRFLGEEFARMAAAVMEAAGFEVVLAKGAVPTPCLDHAVLRLKAQAGICFTASHNPPVYQGFKVIDTWGGMALPDVTEDISQRLADLQNTPNVQEDNLPAPVDITTLYLTDLVSLLGGANSAKRKLRILVNPMHGASCKVLPKLLRTLGHHVEEMRNQPDPYFGGIQPDPRGDTLTDMKELLAADHYDIGLCTDADGDRFGVMSGEGEYYDPNQVLGVLLQAACQMAKKQPSAIAMAHVTSDFVARVAKHLGLMVHKTPVGFKHLGQKMAAGEADFACEESSGFAWADHVPDKDGLVACGLLAQFIASQNSSFYELYTALAKQVGPCHFKRLDLRLKPAQKERLLSQLSPDHIQQVFGREVASVDDQDGKRFIFRDGSFVGMRPSGTEPLLRIYIDAQSGEQCQTFVQKAQAWVDAAQD